MAVSEARLATSALRLPGRWQGFPKATRRWIEGLLLLNPLRRALDTWRVCCGRGPDFEFIEHVLTHGLAVTHPDQRPAPFDVPNHKSCEEPEWAALAGPIIAGEQHSGLISTPTGWFETNHCKWLHPLGLIPKPSARTVRIIHDFSSPAWDCINAHIDYLRTGYERVDAAFAALRPRSFMAKIDISAFFRHIPMDPADWGLLAFRWDGKVFVDTRLNFGSRNAPECAMRFSEAVMWAVRQHLAELGGSGTCEVFVVCDDWLVVAESEAFCHTVWRLIIGLLQRLGFTVNEAPHKCIAPTWVLVWLGLELDSEHMTVRLPADKVSKALECVSAALAAKKLTRRQLDSLFGYLSYCSSVVYGGRAFLHGLRRLRFRGGLAERGARAGHHHVYVNRFLRLDLCWRLENLVLRNGDCRIPIVSMRLEHREEGIMIDARGGDGGVGLWANGGFAGFTGEQCNALYPAGGEIVSPGNWEPPSRDGNDWEMFGYVMFLDVFPLVVQNKFVVFESDSMTASSGVRDLTVHIDSPRRAGLTRLFLSMTVRLNVRVLPRHVRGVDNVYADPLSRNDYSRFGQCANDWCASNGFGRSPFLASL